MACSFVDVGEAGRANLHRIDFANDSGKRPCEVESAYLARDFFFLVFAAGP